VIGAVSLPGHRDVGSRQPDVGPVERGNTSERRGSSESSCGKAIRRFRLRSVNQSAKFLTATSRHRAGLRARRSRSPGPRSHQQLSRRREQADVV